jgi:hypothetical protein
MPNLSTARKAARAMRLAALVLFFAGLSSSLMAQQPSGSQGVRPPAATTIDAATAAAIAAEGELKATIRTFQGDNPSAVYRYYWWHDSCYVRLPPGDYQSVSSDYCHR